MTTTKPTPQIRDWPAQGHLGLPDFTLTMERLDEPTRWWTTSGAPLTGWRVVDTNIRLYELRDEFRVMECGDCREEYHGHSGYATMTAADLHRSMCPRRSRPQ